MINEKREKLIKIISISTQLLLVTIVIAGFLDYKLYGAYKKGLYIGLKQILPYLKYFFMAVLVVLLKKYLKK
ncbi:hypothetical protein [Wukongibacter baidiensis]